MNCQSFEIDRKLFNFSKLLQKFLPFLVFFISIDVNAQDKTPIGQAISTIGKVNAINREKKERELKRGGSFFVLDTIALDAASKAQLKFSDGGIINLIASTEYRVESYVFQDSNQKSEFLSTLVKGGFRAISGEIAKENISGTIIKTPVAVIGLRGTVYETLFINEVLYVGCEEGMIAVSNEYGSLEIGPSSQTLYATVEKGKAPAPSKEKPNALSSVSFNVEGGQPFGPQPSPTLLSPDENVFRNMALFSELSDEEIKALVGVVSCRSYVPGEFIYRQGQSGNSMYVVTKGSLRMDRADPEANQALTISELGPGNYCGEESLVMDQPRSSTIIPLVDSTACEISQETMRKLFKIDPAILQKLMNKIAERDLLFGRAKESIADDPGMAYHQSRSVTRFTPYIGIGAVGVAIIIAATTQRSDHHRHQNPHRSAHKNRKNHHHSHSAASCPCICQ